jgi:hypothetical protein
VGKGSASADRRARLLRLKARALAAAATSLAEGLDWAPWLTVDNDAAASLSVASASKESTLAALRLPVGAAAEAAAAGAAAGRRAA